MDFSWSEENSKIYRTMVDFARKEIDPGALERERDGIFCMEGWRKSAKEGIFRLLVPREFGGCGLDPLTTLIALEGLGYGCRDVGLLFSIGVQICAGVVPVVNFGSHEQKTRFLEGLSSGRDIVGFCATEADSGSDILSIGTMAEKLHGDIMLTGSKVFVTNAPYATLFIVLARDKWVEKPLMGLSIYLVERSRPGVHVGTPIDKMGLRTSPMAEVVFEDCVIPESNRLGAAGAGYTVFTMVMQYERVLLMGIYLGAMKRQIERSCDCARRQGQFDHRTTRFQAVGHRLAEMKVRLEASRLLLYRAAWLLSQGKTAILETSLAKLFSSESYVKNSQDSLEISGLYGCTTGFEPECDLRNALASTLHSGTSEIQKNIIARMLG